MVKGYGFFMEWTNTGTDRWPASTHVAAGFFIKELDLFGPVCG